MTKARTNLKTWSNPWLVLLRQQESESAKILGRRNTGNTAFTFTIVFGHLPPPSESHYSSALHNETSTASSRPSSSPQLSPHLSLLWLHTPPSQASLTLLIYNHFPQWLYLCSLTCPLHFKRMIWCRGGSVGPRSTDSNRLSSFCLFVLTYAVFM